LNFIAELQVQLTAQAKEKAYTENIQNNILRLRLGGPVTNWAHDKILIDLLIDIGLLHKTKMF